MGAHGGRHGNLLSTAARFYLERHPDTLPQITLAEAAAEMIKLRRKANASEAYLADLRCRSARSDNRSVGARQHRREWLISTSEMVTRSLLTRWGRAGLGTLLLTGATVGASVASPNAQLDLKLR